MRLLPPTIPGRVLALSVRIAESPNVATRLCRTFETYHVPATWGLSDPATAESLDNATGNEVAACFPEAAERSHDLVGTLRRFRQVGAPVSTLLCTTEPDSADYDSLVRQGINLIAVGAASAADAAPVMTLRYGLWRLATSLELPGREGWLRGTWAAARSRRRVDLAIRRNEPLHVTIDGAAVLESAQATRVLERLLRHVDRRRQQGLLSVVTLAEIAQQLGRPRAAATAESILRVRAA